MLSKQAIDVSFAQGLDQKSDPKRVSIGKFVSLENTVFNKGGLLQKRNGYGQLASLANSSFAYLTTLNGNLTAIGQSIAALNSDDSAWVSKGSIQPLSVRTLPLIRNNINQTAADSVTSPNGLICTVYTETDGSTTTNKYVIANAVTGQNIVAPAAIPVSSGIVSGGMRVFYLGNNFILMFTNTITATPHLQYVAISATNPTVVGSNTDIASSYVTAPTLSWDGYVFGTNLFIAYNTTTGGQAIKVTKLTSTLNLVSAVTFAGRKATMMTVTADASDPFFTPNPVIYVSFYDLASFTGYSLAVDQNLNTVMAPQQIIPSGTFLNINAAAQGGTCTVFAELQNAYSYDSGVPTNLVEGVTVVAHTSTVGSPFVSARSIGLASKAFIVSGTIYYLAAYQSAYQPSYFLINGSLSSSSAPVVSAKLAYQNGGGYLTIGLPSVSVVGTLATVPYRFKDVIQAVNKNTNVPSGSQTAGIYSQTGINLGSFSINTDTLGASEIADDLHITGGFLWMYDGYLPVEHNFFLWPDNVETSTATGSGNLSAQDYFYQVTYEWTDNQGNAYRSAPSIPVKQTTTTASSTNTIHVPTLRLTYKTKNPVKIVIYRWSAGQQAYYQVTSITAPLLNDTTVDQVVFSDTFSDATILGNNLIYTTGGVVEDVNAPASDLLTLFDTRLWLVDAEDRNLLWYSKQVIEATPVEMSDLFTLFISPTVATASGEMTSIYPMDDKLIISKGGNSFVYINGTGPDNTGANSQYSQPIFITSTVGCANQKSIVAIPQGLLFQSNKGIWLLDRGLGTNYIGAPVEDFTTGALVTSVVTVPETNQVRFTMSSGITLMYDYYYNQWSTFINVPAISSCIFDEMHTFINSFGQVYQETSGQYLDGSSPVLVQFTTGPLRLDQLQSYQRAYFFFLLGEYISPHKLMVSVAYNYSKTPSHSSIISPTNFSPAFGSGASSSPFGQGTPFGGPSTLENWRVFLQQQRCQAFSISVQEIYDASFGIPAGAGLTISGLNVIVGLKKPYRPIPAAQSVG